MGTYNLTLTNHQRHCETGVIISFNYSHVLHNNFLVNDGLHILQWSHKIMMRLKNSYCLGML